jgi:hypothetical protein
VIPSAAISAEVNTLTEIGTLTRLSLRLVAVTMISSGAAVSAFVVATVVASCAKAADAVSPATSAANET